MRPKWRKYSSRRTGQPQHLTRIISYKTFYKLDSKALWGVREGRTEHVAGWDLAPAREAPRLCTQTGFLPSPFILKGIFLKSKKKIKGPVFLCEELSKSALFHHPPLPYSCYTEIAQGKGLHCGSGPFYRSLIGLKSVTHSCSLAHNYIGRQARNQISSLST